MPVKTGLKDSSKLQKKAKIALGRSKDSNVSVKTLGSKKRGVGVSEKVGSRGKKAADVSSETPTRGVRNVKSNIKNEATINGNKGSKSTDVERKRKRIYADKKEITDRLPRRNSLSTAVQDVVKNDFVKRKGTLIKRTLNKKSPDFDQSSGHAMSRSGQRKSKESSLLDKTGLKAKKNGADKGKDAETAVLRKRIGKSTPEHRKQPDQNRSNKVAGFLEKTPKKNVPNKKGASGDSEPTDDRPKKKKRVIRIDPNDFSNKRMDDGIALKENGKEKKEDSSQDNNAEMSKNAQFRAIQPSPSILSFVEDNLLGRRREIELRRAGYNTELSVPLDNIPFSTSTERERIEEAVFRNKLTFFAAAKVSSSFPPPDLPEIAFAGRSNVGKSSLLNALTRQWGVVRTSDKPGLTQTINFFKLGSKLCLVDLPGYGFAYAKEEVKEAWEELVKEYVSTRVGLKRVCLLVDTKWGLKPRDYELIDLMERSETKYQIVMTKSDLVLPIDVARRAMQIEESLKANKSAVQPAMIVSSKSGAGIRSLRTVLTRIGRFVKA